MKNLNKKYHALLKDIYDNAHQIKFYDWADDDGENPLTFKKGEDYDCVTSTKDTPLDQDRSLKTIFLEMDLGYKKSIPDQMKITTEDLRIFHKRRHIDFIMRVIGQNGIAITKER